VCWEKGSPVSRPAVHSPPNEGTDFLVARGKKTHGLPSERLMP